ncbi:hypothetical protein BSLG_009308 [Batrachochytrium salamandrivorans]|nr:hypothetical protein BSLG_009308 [Batrachochytrium salamandrivorans]
MLLNCLERLLAEASRFKDLRELLEDALRTLADQRKALEASGDDPADHFWLPFKAALHPSRPVKIRETALNLIQKLIAHNLLRGALPSPPHDPNSDPANSTSASLASSQSILFNRRFSISHLFRPDDTVSSSPSQSRPQQHNQSPQSPAHAGDLPTSVASKDIQDMPSSESVAQNSEMGSSAGTVQASKSAAALASETSIGRQLIQTEFLMDEIISTVVLSINNQQANAAEEALQLQVLQVLLTAVTSTECEVHERSLVHVVQVCFAIHANGAKNSTNEVTAKASLTQMINLIFSRMERYADVLSRNLELGAPTLKLPRSSSVIEIPASHNPTSRMSLTQSDKVLRDSIESSSQESLEINSDSKQALDISSDSKQALEIPEVQDFPQEQSLYDAVDNFNTASGEINDSTDVPHMEQQTDDNRSLLTLEQPVDVTNAFAGIPPHSPVEEQKLASVVGADSTDATDSNPYNPSVSFYNQLLRKDVYLVLRFLCYMSMHSDDQSQSTTFNPAALLAPTAAPHDELLPISIKSRILAMDLILSVLNNIGPILRTDELYLRLVRENLCLSISRNAVNTNPSLFELSLSIFLLVIRYYRDQLKVEVEVLLSTVYLQILEMGNSTYKQKIIVLQGLIKICETPQTLVDLYVNYDCDMAMSSVFEKIINICSKITQGRTESSSKASVSSSFGIVGYAVGLDSKAELVREQDRRLKVGGLCALVAAIQSLQTWSQDPVSQDNTSNPSQDKLLADADASCFSPNFKAPGLLDGLMTEEMPERPESAASNPDPISLLRSPDGVANTTAAFMNALAPTNQSHTVVVGNRNPLLSVTMGKDGSFEPTTGSGLTTNETNPKDMESVVSRKQLLRRAVRIFNQKPTKGIQFLIEVKFITPEPDSIAEFLLSTPELSKSAVGIYLGEGNAENIKVMHAFVDALEFGGMDFVAALRFFLQHFRLPGEAQKIDRMMEKFADRYCESNLGVFANADAAYTLAFSVMMLNTDQHSSQIKNRMDKPSFIKNNRGINGDGDLPDEFLNAVFDEIHNNEIIMEEEHANGKLARITMGWGAGDLNDRQRMDLYKKEVSMIQKKSQMLMKAGPTSRVYTPFRSAMGRDLARPMFAMAAWALVATFSLLFESAVDDGSDVVDFTSRLSGLSDPDISSLCLRGFSGAIHIACVFKLETERDAFVSSLAKLTSLNNFYKIKSKNVKAIRILIDLAQSLAELMESSWVQLIKTVSQIERMEMAVSHVSQPPEDYSTGKTSKENRSTESQWPTGERPRSSGNMSDPGYRSSNYGDQAQKKIPATLENLVLDFQSQTSIIVIDRIFSKTVNLSATAIIHFFKAVCQVSLEEVGIDSKGLPITTATPGPPRMYLLQKIVEVAHYNVHRIRFEWTQIWRILQPHFSIIACHPNQHVATFAVDSLRQLCMKFLEREELGHFSSQHEYLRGFEWIIRHTTSAAIRELVLTSITHMVTARATSIRSGWKSIFVVLSKAGQGDERMAKSAFATVQMIFRTHFEDVVSTGGFVDLVSCLAEFALLKGQGPAHDELVMGSIQLLQSCTKSLIERAKEESELPNAKSRIKRPSLLVVGPTHTSSSGMGNHRASLITSPHVPRINNLPQQAYLMANGCVSESHFYLSWFPIFSAFSRVIIESDGVLVRTHTMETLFDMLRTSSHLFDSKYWRTIHRNIISPIFEDLSDPATEPVSGEANSAVLILGLRLLVEMISLHFDLLVRGSVSGDKASDTGGQEFVQNSLERMLFMMGKKDDKLAATGQICFQQFLLNNVHKLARQGQWTWLIDIIEGAFQQTLPVELLNCATDVKADLTLSGEDRPTTPASAPVAAVTTPVAAVTTPAVATPTPAAATTLISDGSHVEPSNVSEGGSLLSSDAIRPNTVASPAAVSRDSSKNNAIMMSEIMETAQSAARESGNPLTLDDLDFDHTIIKCVTHLELLQTVRDFCLTDISASLERESTIAPPSPMPTARIYAIGAMASDDRSRVLKCVYSSYTLARSFNSLTDLRHAIWRRGWVSQLPNLVKQETVSFSAYLVMLFGAYKTIGDGSVSNGDVVSTESVSLVIVDALVRQSIDLLDRYIEFLADAPKYQREIALRSPIVVLLYRELLSIDDWWPQHRGKGPYAVSHRVSTGDVLGAVDTGSDGVAPKQNMRLLRRHLPRYFRRAIRMMSVDRLEVRQVLQEFMERVEEEYIHMDE